LALRANLRLGPITPEYVFIRPPTIIWSSDMCIDRGLKAAREERFASDVEVKGVFAKHRPA
ncbi:MAG: hypothetical protein WAN75_43680, partial [Xanthobacteraceae bacterium]